MKTGRRKSVSIQPPLQKKYPRAVILTMAAVGSPYAAEHFGLQILKEGIFDAQGNTTRFVIISGQKRFVKDAQKISVCMELPHQSGSLYNALAHFIYNDLNMTKDRVPPDSAAEMGVPFLRGFRGELKRSGSQKRTARTCRQNPRNSGFSEIINPEERAVPSGLFA